MSFLSMTPDDVAELLRKITTARTHADTVKTDENLIALAKSQAEAAEAYLILGETGESKNLFSFALDTLGQVNRPETTADFYERIGKAFSRSGKYSDASGYFIEAVKIYETIPHDFPEGRNALAGIYKNCADSLMKTGRNDDAIALLTRMRDMLKKGYENTSDLSDLIGWADGVYYLGNAYGQYESYDVSLKLYEEAMTLYLSAERDYKTDTRRSVANCLIGIGGIFELRKDYDAALEKYEKALEINRQLAVKNDDEYSLKHLAASCTHTAELYETMGYLVKALSLFREKADVSLRLSKIKPVIEAPEVLFLTPPEDFFQRLERFESKLPWYSLLFEMDNPSRDKLYITYFTMGRLIEELAEKNKEPGLYPEALKLFETSDSILSMLAEEFPETEKEIKLREIKSAVRRIRSLIMQGGNHDE